MAFWGHKSSAERARSFPSTTYLIQPLLENVDEDELIRVHTRWPLRCRYDRRLILSGSEIFPHRSTPSLALSTHQLVPRLL